MPVLLPGPLATTGTVGLFPDEDLELTCEAAFGADLTQAPDTWAWTDLSDRVIDEPITVTRGVVVGGRSSRTSSGSVILLNDDGQFTPHHPGSSWWPYVDQGTPVRVSVRTRTAPIFADGFSRVVAGSLGTADSGQAWNVNAAFNVAGGQGTVLVPSGVRASRTPTAHQDVDITWQCTTDQTAATASITFGPQLRSNSSGSNHIHPVVEFTTAGTVRASVYTVQSNTFTLQAQTTQPGLTYLPGTVIQGRALLVGARLRVKTWLAAGIEPAAWTVDVTLPLADLTLDDTHLGVVARLTGSSNTNTTFTFDNIVAQQPRYPRLEGYIANIQPSFLPVNENTIHSVAVVEVGGVGVRLELLDAEQWSPMRRSIQLAPITPVAYWPLEDAERSTSAASAIAGQPAMTVSGPVVFDADVGVPDEDQLQKFGTKNLVSLAAGASLSAQIVPSVSASQWTVGVSVDVYARDVPVSELRIVEWETGGGSFTRWALLNTTTGHVVRAYNDNLGTTTDVITHVNNFGGTVIAYDVTAVQNGGNIDVTFYANANNFATGSVAGTMGAPTRVTLNPDKTNTTGSTSPFGIRFTVGHLVVKDVAGTSLPFYFGPGATLSAESGWYRESPELRTDRLCTEERIPFRVAEPADADHLTRLNTQQEGAFVELVEAAVNADSGGLLYEAEFGYELLPRTARYNRDVALTVDLATYRRSGDTAAEQVLVPQLAIRAPTVHTVERTGGSQAMWAASEAFRKRRGSLGTKATLDLLSDADTLPHVQWRVHLVEDAQDAHYPGMIVDLGANPDLISAWLACTVGHRVQRTNQPTIAGLGTIDQVIEGITETIGRRMWQAAIDGAPANVWDVGIYDDPDWLLDSSSTTLAADQPATSVGASEAWVFSTADVGDVWETTLMGADNCVLGMNGEEILITGMSAVSGTGPYLQTATVTRGHNGVVKNHQAGDEVHLLRPFTWAL